MKAIAFVPLIAGAFACACLAQSPAEMDKAAYDATATKLAGLFAENFATYAGGASAEVKAAVPKA